MDKAAYVAMTGAMQTLRAQEVVSHNLANVSTIGFRAELASAQAAAVPGEGLPTRVNAVLGRSGFDPTSGALQQTGRDLDVAVRGDGWIAVQAPDGSEAYTRAGDLKVTELGQLVTGAGHAVMGEGAPLSVPPYSQITIGGDGTVSIVPQGQGPATVASVGRIKVVNIAPEQLERGSDGLMRARPGADVQPVAGNALATGALESSNVNMADALVSMIELSRQFEMQVRMLRTTEDNARAGASILRLK